MKPTNYFEKRSVLFKLAWRHAQEAGPFRSPLFRWPRLQKLVPKDVKEAIQHAQSAMSREPGLRREEAL